MGQHTRGATRTRQAGPAAEALTALAEARSAVERARRHAYEQHRLAGAGDANLIRAVHLLRQAGHHDLADAVCRQLVGRGVAEDRWQFEVDESHDDDFSRSLTTLQDDLRARLPARPSRPPVT